jgi:hypothetical protein
MKIKKLLGSVKKGLTSKAGKITAGVLGAGALATAGYLGYKALKGRRNVTSKRSSSSKLRSKLLRLKIRKEIIKAQRSLTREQMKV